LRTVSWRGGGSLSTFERKLLLMHCYQVAYINFLRSRTADGYTGLFIMYVLLPRERSCELILMILTDNHRKVTTTFNRDERVNQFVCLQSACRLVFRGLCIWWVSCSCSRLFPIWCSIRAATVGTTGTVVGQVLIMRTYRSKPSGLLLATILFFKNTQLSCSMSSYQVATCRVLGMSRWNHLSGVYNSGQRWFYD